MLPGRLAMIFEAIAANFEVSDADRTLLDLPEAQNVTQRRRALARAVLREEPGLVRPVIAGELSLPTARRQAHDHQYRVSANPPAERAPLDEAPPLTPWAASLTASSLVGDATITQHAARSGLPVACILGRLRQGWDVSTATMTPLSPIISHLVDEDHLGGAASC
jgi:hypothetical protein